MHHEEIMIEGGPIREHLLVGGVVHFQSQESSKNIAFKIGTINSNKNNFLVHMLGKINPDTSEEMNCEIFYNPDNRSGLSGMIYNIKKPFHPMLASR